MVGGTLLQWTHTIIRSMKPIPWRENGRKCTKRLFLEFKVQITEKHRRYRTLMAIISPSM